jgi:oxygen-dependent protoporphyrinogen oxidase
MTVNVIGAGFAGLTLAYELTKAGFDVEVFEKSDRCGGLLSTLKADHGLVETAANALLCDRHIEELCLELDVPLARRFPMRNKRYIFWNRPKRWPLSPLTTTRLLLQAWALRLGKSSLAPQSDESVARWARRFGGRKFEERLLVPALQGVYAGDPEKMSAKLIVGSLLRGRPPRGREKGSVAPAEGMGQLISSLGDTLKSRGVRFHLGQDFAPRAPIDEPTVICTSAWQAARLLQAAAPELAGRLSACESLPLISATGFFEPHPDDLQGFGCLFPKSQGFQSLGVLFNASIFEGRSDMRSETWILGGAGGQDLLERSDADLTRAIYEDRDKLCGGRLKEALSWHISKWPRAIPHYTLAWQKQLEALEVEPPLFLHGNYLGHLGLARIYSRSRQLATDLRVRYG